MPEESYVIHKEDDIGSYKLSYFPGCWSLIISHSVEILRQLRGKGHGQRQHEERLHVAQHDISGKYILCTVNSDNAVEKHILAKNGWKLLDSFYNCTSNYVDDRSYHGGVRAAYVELWGRQLQRHGIVSPHLLQSVSFEAGEGDR